jgi:hypothetical protein
MILDVHVGPKAVATRVIALEFLLLHLGNVLCG